MQGKPKEEGFDEKLRENVDEAKGPTVKEGLGIGTLGEEGDVHLVRFLETSHIEGVKCNAPDTTDGYRPLLQAGPRLTSQINTIHFVLTHAYLGPTSSGSPILKLLQAKHA